MRYADNNDAKAGDIVQIDVRYKGRVIACMDTLDFLPGAEHWAELKVGIMVDTDFGGLVHYTPEATDELILIRRAEQDDISH
jgi:hypothetical protein